MFVFLLFHVLWLVVIAYMMIQNNCRQNGGWYRSAHEWRTKIKQLTCMYVCIYEWQWHFYSLFMFLSSCFLKYCWPTTLSFSNFLFEPKKKVRRKHDDSRSIHRNMCFLLSFLLALNFFFVSSLFSRLDDNSRRYHYTWAVWLLLSPVEDRRKKNRRKRINPWTWHFVQDIWTKERNEPGYIRHLFWQLSWN
jgi:hypothetical protein